jgi:CRP-like cAMP-binding protein
MNYANGLLKPKLPLSMTDDGNPLIKKFNFLQSLNCKEIDILKRLHEQEINIDANKIMLYPGKTSQQCFIVNQGWAYRYYDLMNGDRQIINFYLPGDIINPFALVRPKVNYSIASISPLHLSVFEPDYLISLLAHEKLGLLFMKMLNGEDSLSMEQIVRLGNRTAYQRTAHLLLEFFDRLKIVGHTENDSFTLPLTQQLLAETLGLSLVYMNRTIKKMQLQNLIRIESKRVCILNTVRLKQIAEYQSLDWQHDKQSLAA